ncbi:MAG: tRNA uridine(34) 5-carboxymethylaminomethyl modification radical SAM/GNAT enzyme Elp3 [Dehalococcoidales bacterium]|nr:tRNA uridine(34) 5-carboxymethylaminomethyl modification radical SAM/GNAT enzyme Elp3 [Dehalococcoidales bacterium]MDP7524888.1 tRNA uridine(34) 5-carboxymethylaminomethyl modification radical SAM/GNAT enzyme Elp3 [Dehalococcoidales bacterium]
MRKAARTISGVTPVAVMTLPMNCPGQCIYCPTFSDTPQSYTPRSPAVLRAKSCEFDAGQQVKMRLRILSDMGHPTDKIELIVMGGTFLASSEDYQYRFIKGCFDALNGRESANLKEAKQLNETALHRCTGLCIETRPDWCGQEQIDRMLEFGATRVELGVQTLDDEIYRLVRRGHTVADVVTATRLLREHAFKVHYHWMPGLPGSTPEKDLALSEQLFSDPRFRPDGLKIYPTMVVEGTELERWYLDGQYQPYTDDIMTDLVADIKTIVPGYVRISRVLRDIPSEFIVGGLKDSLRDVVKQRMRLLGTECKCIRCREYGHRVRAGREAGPPRMVRTDYEASGDREVFLSFEDEDETIFGLLRMRVQSEGVTGLMQNAADNLALIRELHIFGPEVPLNEQNPAAAQHKGLGRALLAEAERIAGEEFQVRQIAVLSGTGAREYYRSGSDYSLQADYMVKNLQS